MKKTILFLTVTLLQNTFLATAFAQTTAVTVVAEPGGIGEDSCRTARRILIAELRTAGIDVGDRPELDRVHPVDDEVKKIASDVGAQKVFVLRLSALGQKVVVDLEELTPALEMVRGRRLSSKGAEELDLVIPRLVKALITNQPVEETEQIGNLTQQEGRKWEKKPGEFLWGVGVMTGGALAADSTFAYGFDLKFSYEMERFRLNADIGGMFSTKDDSFGWFRTDLGIAYLPLTGSWSPYFGGGLGFMTLNNGVENTKDGSGLGLVVNAGVEFFRLHSARVLVEVGCMFPFFSLEDNNGNGQTQSTYAPVGYGSFAILW